MSACLPTCFSHPVTAGGALAATLERAAVKLMVDDMLQDLQEHAEQKRGYDQAQVRAKPPFLHMQTRLLKVRQMYTGFNESYVT